MIKIIFIGCFMLGLSLGILYIKKITKDIGDFRG